jgi:hypothetical protein
MTAPSKSNATPDLSDDEYMEQLHLLAQVVSTMPGITPEHANVTTPAPIRARWAAYMIKLGVRIDPDLATHKLIRTAGISAGNHAPRELKRLSRDDMWGYVKEQSPELYEKLQRGEADIHDFQEGIGEDLMAAIMRAMEERRREIEAEKRREGQ